ncbi:MAG: lysophospholipid acyltransferase family protein [Lentisphaeria bacterium]
MKPYFAPPEYHTPADYRAPLLHRLLPRAVSFYSGVLRCIVRAQYYAARGRFDQTELGNTSALAIRLFERSGARFHITGLDQLATVPGGAVIIGNHMSSLETFALPCLVIPWKPICFVIKDSLLRHPLFGAIMRAQTTVAVSRTNPREDLAAVLHGGERVLRDGCAFCLFPQSTRHVAFDEGKFNTLGVKVARRAGAMVVPVALRTDYWGNGRLIKDMGPVGRCRDVHIAFGAPLSPELPQAELHGRVVAFIRDRLAGWGVPTVGGAAAERPPATPGAAPEPPP